MVRRLNSAESDFKTSFARLLAERAESSFANAAKVAEIIANVQIVAFLTQSPRVRRFLTKNRQLDKLEPMKQQQTLSA